MTFSGMLRVGTARADSGGAGDATALLGADLAVEDACSGTGAAGDGLIAFSPVCSSALALSPGLASIDFSS
jgi:hypothetical protein